MTKDGMSITKAIGGNSYTLVVPSASPWPVSLAKNILTLVAAPLIVPSLMVSSILMSTSLRNKLISIFVPWFMGKVDGLFSKERSILLRTIGPETSVLDVGSGGGAYLAYCQSAKRVVAVEPVKEMHHKIRHAGKNLRELTTVSDLQDLNEEESFDFCILGNVLCEVPNVDSTLQQIDRHLKPGAMVYFSEHIGRPKGTWQRWIQNTINPWYCHTSGGCNCNRDSLQSLQRMGNWNIIYWTFGNVQVVLGPMVLGLAVKDRHENTPTT